MGLLEDLKSKILIGDGATGTLLYSHGIDSCFEELNITKPEEVSRIHRAYVEAGANVIQTNTYAANYQKLARYGLEDSVKDINVAGVKLAKQAAKDQAYVVGTLGGIRSFQKNAISLEEVKRSIREQMFWLLNEGVDGLLFETYYDFEELKTVLTLARKETDKPIITHVSLHDIGVLQDGRPLADALKELEALGADVVGLNCRLGPYHMIQSLEEVPLPDCAFLSAYPNASLPAYVEGKLEYETNEDYFVESARLFREQGVRLIGGCCGTTPAHVRAMSSALKDLPPITSKVVKMRPAVTVQEREQQDKPHMHEIVKKRRSVIVELDPPKQLGPTKFLEGAKALDKVGVDAITLADNSLASPRISNLAMATLMQQETKARPLIHITCRDRNLIGLQSHLMGLHTLGMNQVLAITGDPSKVGDFPGATSVYDLSSFDLISLIAQFNEGLSYSGKPLGQKTNFSIAAAFNPNVRHLDRAVQRLEKKIDCGAHYFITQPLYSTKQIEEVYEATKHLTTPVYIGIMPLTSARNARFIHHEVPGIKLSEDILERMDATGNDRIRGEVEGLAIAKNLIDTAYELFDGIYLITPFMRYEMTEILTRYIHDKQLVTSERKI
ncbi:MULTISPECIES: bifunctional homocysteine S-methyltransferase/methylenetetrahydrofolate reductase [Priestia]|jgi:methionine synthase / methylenetetrahydrofolate reductase(NADPH)|uniref:Homocysteine S-methyltransferase/5,10-methylenetetrahydrofolate reductase n=1 Tax=Priestia megaterium (strain ATCC 12872 / QMB1551) TaxID=545693 RepID=D5E064_PRIM1|nr:MULTISPECIES: bifunctional homocysteine S-methyltransferase/methylenetetrahydrofolate reductase [Priestia]KOP73583.1 homocysteine methyltransferase [Bacillus sp. FJAT-21351]KQU26695.1 homocysteine methyltransferase [Bacillus sp. Leaf75]MDH6655784.1 homocysteine S-methyltransferase [Bacillus sp. PvP124]ADE68327.1 homocysteine S-methyltransferase/5,10-methylenetetrahydrofolate reductase [Priestia megaterium QM B1551]MBG9934331.1 homocysteine methyltransferase [Priestia aryabhattai]